MLSYRLFRMDRLLIVFFFLFCCFLPVLNSVSFADDFIDALNKAQRHYYTKENTKAKQALLEAFEILENSGATASSKPEIKPETSKKLGIKDSKELPGKAFFKTSLEKIGYTVFYSPDVDSRLKKHFNRIFEKDYSYIGLTIINRGRKKITYDPEKHKLKIRTRKKKKLESIATTMTFSMAINIDHLDSDQKTYLRQMEKCEIKPGSIEQRIIIIPGDYPGKELRKIYLRLYGDWIELEKITKK